LPFFIQWLTFNHPSNDGNAVAHIETITIASSTELSNSLFNEKILDALEKISVQWVDPSDIEPLNGILSISIDSPNGVVEID